jgi:5-oxoprolinase (ATP-hydrolysing)
MTPWTPQQDPADAFADAYHREYGFILDRSIVVDDLRVRAAGRATPLPAATTAAAAPPPLPPPSTTTSAYFEAGGRQDTPVYLLSDLAAGHAVVGPVILIDQISTVVVEPGWVAHVTGDLNLRLEKQAAAAAAAAAGGVDGTQALTPSVSAALCDPIQLAIFSHR